MNNVVFAQLCLASQSPRRRELLEQIGVDYFSVPADIDETMKRNESPLDYVKRMADEKAVAVQQLGKNKGAPVLASDTAVVIAGEVLGKPANKTDGIAMLQRLSGKTHQVLTSVAMHHEARNESLVVASAVTFRTLTLRECEHYWSTGEGLDKAGCYAIQGKAATFITQISGSFSGVMGLPLRETSELLERWGVQFWLTASNESEEL